MTDTTPAIPPSNALAEASPESLNELFSRDPEGYSDQDLTKVVEALRLQRKRWMELEGAKTDAKAKPKGKTPGVLSTSISIKDLDL